MAKSKNSLLYEKMILENLARPFLQITGVRAAYLLERRSTRSSFTRYCITRPRKLPPPAISSALPPQCNTSTSKSPPNNWPAALHFPPPVEEPRHHQFCISTMPPPTVLLHIAQNTASVDSLPSSLRNTNVLETIRPQQGRSISNPRSQKCSVRATKAFKP